MSHRPIILLIAIVILPMALLAWAGVRLARHQQQQAEEQIRQLLGGQLNDLDRTIAEQFATLAADLQELTAIDENRTEPLREITRSDPRLFQLFVIDPEDVLMHPDPDGPLLQTEREFIVRAAQIINDRQLQQLATAAGKESAQTGDASQGPAPTSGWFTWYWGPGLQLIYWQRRETGHIVAAALDRSRWIADLIANLPDTPVADFTANSASLRTRLVDSSGNTLYQWGRVSAEATGTTVTHRLSEPLSSWQLEIDAPLADMTASAGSASAFNLLAGLTVTGLALAALAVIFYKQYARDMREAAQRVSFVNQVSHELRTPLTNIRLYAELLGQDLSHGSGSEGDLQRRTGVIIAEAGRLSRLIDNVLALARKDRQSLEVKRRPCVADQIIDDVLARFAPSLEQKGIEVTTDLNAKREFPVDEAILEQILGNLISNVEKYAASGLELRISSRQAEDRVSVLVSDAGPGVPPGDRHRVFEPFWRASNELDQAAGTGIGLTISREMARLHGGDVTLVPSERGATFMIELRAQTVNGDNR